MTAQAQSDYVGGLPAGCLLNEYQIERVLGHGGFGVTYLARDTMLQKAVAIKEYLPTEWAVRQAGNTVSVRSSEDRMAFEQGQTSFLNEARVLARFHHPNLIAVYRFFQANSTAYFVMEYAEGETLRSLIKKMGTLDEELIKRLLIPVIQGLDGVHEAGIMHRDIKPENILVRKDGSAVLIDFGAARIATGSKSRAITSVLTAGYAPVEQYSTSGNQGPWTDIYALGAVMYYAICGRKPLDAISRMSDDALVPATLAGQDRYSHEFLAAVDWALRVRAEERPQHLKDWLDVLEGHALAPEFALPAPIDITGPGAETPNQTVRAEASNRTVRADATVRAENLPPPPARPTPTARPAPTPTARVTATRPSPASITRPAPTTRPTPTRPTATARPVTRSTPPPPPAVADEAYEMAAEAPPPAASPPHRSNTAMMAGIAAGAVAAAGFSGWYFSKLGAQREVVPPPAAVSQPAPVPAPVPVVDEAAERAKQQAAEQQRQQEQLKQKQARDEAERQKALELKQQQEAAERQRQLELQKQQAAVAERQRVEAERQKALQAQKQQAAEQQRKREMELKAQQEQAEAQKREAERVAAEKRALEEKKKAEAARQAKADEEKKKKAEEEGRRAAEQKAAQEQKKPESKPKEDAPVGF